MNKKAKYILTAVIALVLAGAVIYCVRFGNKKVPENGNGDTSVIETAMRLMQIAENASVCNVSLSDSGITADKSGVTVNGNRAEITSGGAYRISGKISDGSIGVNCDDEVILILDGADILCSGSAAIDGIKAAHIAVFLAENSVNSLKSGAECEITETDESFSASGAALYSKSDLSIGGSGILNIGGYINNGIASADEAVILGGTVEVSAVNNGIKANDNLSIIDGKINIICGNDGLKCENDEDTTLGNIDITGGDVSVTSFGDGAQAQNNLNIADGNITVKSGNEAEAMQTAENIPEMPGGEMPDFGEEPLEMPGGEMPDFGEEPPEMPGGEMRMGRNGGKREMQSGGEEGFGKPDMKPDGEEGFGRPDFENNGEKMQDFKEAFKNKSDDTSKSAKGLKSGNKLTISGGTVNISSADDGIHTDGELTVTAGDITVSRSIEGMEANIIDIRGGNINLTASDDGMNASGVSPVLRISGGTVYVNASGDGLDSNGDLIIEGGNVTVDGPTNNGDGALDSGTENGGSLLCNGGTVIAVGASGMAESFGSKSAQPCLNVAFKSTCKAETDITVKDSTGKIIFEHKSAKSFSSVVFSSPGLKSGEKYTVTAGELSQSVTA